ATVCRSIPDPPGNETSNVLTGRSLWIREQEGVCLHRERNGLKTSWQHPQSWCKSLQRYGQNLRRRGKSPQLSCKHPAGCWESPDSSWKSLQKSIRSPKSVCAAVPLS